MLQRKGFSNYIRKIEGTQVPHYPVGKTFYTLKCRNRVIKEGSLRWVVDAFTWRTTPQGFSFWQSINEGYGDQSKAVEILTSWREQGYV